MKKLVFRFDIDTHKCMRERGPNLLDISGDMGVKFTFFLNVGRAVSIRDSLCDILKSNCEEKSNARIFLSQAEKRDLGFLHDSDDDTDNIQMMSAFSKLGFRDYIVAAIINPKNVSFKKNIKMLINSNCEVGIHGGRNHAVWHNHAYEWDKSRLRKEIEWAIENIKNIVGDYKPIGFASPGWVSPDGLDEVLQEMNFKYSADFRKMGGLH